VIIYPRKSATFGLTPCHTLALHPEADVGYLLVATNANQHSTNTRPTVQTKAKS